MPIIYLQAHGCRKRTDGTVSFPAYFVIIFLKKPYENEWFSVIIHAV